MKNSENPTSRKKFNVKLHSIQYAYWNCVSSKFNLFFAQFLSILKKQFSILLKMETLENIKPIVSQIKIQHLKCRNNKMENWKKHKNIFRKTAIKSENLITNNEYKIIWSASIESLCEVYKSFFSSITNSISLWHFSC
jgi:hypothetical protein